MVYRLFTRLALVLLLAVPASLSAQETVTPGEEVRLNPTEFTSLVRKMAELRRRRVLLYQQQMAVRMRAARRMQPANETKTVREERKIVRRDDGGSDTLVIVRVNENGEVSEKTTSTTPSRRSAANNGVAERQEMTELRRRLDEQEMLLLDLQDRLAEPVPTYNEYAKVPTPPSRADTIINRITVQGNPDGLSKSDLNELTRELSRMNDEVARLRDELDDEQRRRRRAEADTERARDRNREYLRDRERDRDRERTTLVPAPVVVEKEGPVRIVRDTVYVDRTVNTPVFVPTTTRPDTVVIERETVREVPVEPVVITKVEEREVVRTDTLKLAAREPISFPTIFFDNNSSALNATHRNLLSTLVSDMRNRPGYTVRLTGYSSKSGNAAYNQQLSARRADAVRQGLIDAGWPADRISTVPGGIDYQPASPAAARRVEVQALPKQ